MSSPDSVAAREEPTPGPEEWTLDHPELGEVRVYVGTQEQLRALDPGFPMEKKEGEKDESAAKMEEKLDAIFPSIVVRREGMVVARLKSLSAHKIPLAVENAPQDGEYTKGATGSSRPRLRIETGFLGRWLKSAYVEDAHGGVVDIIPPIGSRAEKYYHAMESSPWKRLVYPLTGGLGKAGWAVALLVLGPLIGWVIDWLFGLIPDYSLPSIPWPNISLPSVSIPWPDFSLPRIPWPHIPWPSIAVPEWITVAVEHRNIWLPILLGLVVGVVSLRRAGKARRTRQRWGNRDGSAGERGEGTAAELAAERDSVPAEDLHRTEE